MANSTTRHTIYTGLSQNLSHIQDDSIELVVTSPPYPMIEMWDEIMSKQNVAIASAIDSNDGNLAFELMHKELDKVWQELTRVVVPGGFVCINIGDATRNINNSFALYPNHARVISYFINNGFVNLPNIIWRKQTNAPNKFMGSGMLPAGAYATLEHEWILIFRKGDKRIFKTEEEKSKRRKSAFFWEERNLWFSDIWSDIKGTAQRVSVLGSRDRSAAYPFDIPYRLINMYSIAGDTVLDPFVGTGTTSIAALTCGRNSIGYDVDSSFAQLAIENISSINIYDINDITHNRVESHNKFISERTILGREIKHFNESLKCPVVTSQETSLEVNYLTEIKKDSNNSVYANYSTQSPIKLITRAKRAKSLKIEDMSSVSMLNLF